MEKNAPERKIITHDFPVWYEKADFIIRVNLNVLEISDLATSEQIWARQIEDDIFEVCCIPFFAYGISLGDYVRTKNDGESKYLICENTSKNGHTTYRIWLNFPDESASIIDEIRSLGCLVEVRWAKSRLIAIDAPDLTTRAQLEVFLKVLEGNGSGECEIAE